MARIPPFTKVNVLKISLILFIAYQAVSLFKYTKLSAGNSPSSTSSRVELKEIANEVIKKCKDEQYPPDCYDNEIPTFMGNPTNISLEDAFKVVSFIQEKDTRYQYCHVAAHNISAKETIKNIHAWKDVVTRCPTTVCNNGCAHGAIMERYKGVESLTDEQIEEAKPDLLEVCEPRGNWHPTQIELSMCYHALGHLNMYMTNANIDKSNDICKYIGKKNNKRNMDYTGTCVEGVFMSIFQPLEPEDVALVKNIVPKKKDALAFCATYSDMAYHACNREKWALFKVELITPEGLTKFCSYTNDHEAQEHCYGALMNQITVRQVVQNNNNTKNIKDFCTKLQSEWVGHCLAHAARRLMQLDPNIFIEKAIEVCAIAESLNVGEKCYSLLTYNIAKISFLPGSDIAKTQCKKLPNPWGDKCLSITGS